MQAGDTERTRSAGSQKAQKAPASPDDKIGEKVIALSEYPLLLKLTEFPLFL